jgi:adenylate cyclase
LSRVSHLFVIARISSFTYKGKAEKVQTIARELGVKYLLEGSARRAGDRVRVNVQLVDAATGNEVWSQRYDRQLGDIFNLQDELVQSLVTTLGLQLSVLEKGMVIPQRTNKLEAYDYLLHSVEYLFSLAPDAFRSARDMLEKAIALDPSYADAYSSLAFLDITEYFWQSDRNPRVLDRAAELVDKAIALEKTGCLHRAWLRR